MALKLKPVVDKLEDVPEALREAYLKRETDGKFVLDLDGIPPGLVPQEKLEEFRKNNIKLMNELEDQKKLRTLTPEEEADFNKMKETERKLKEKELLDAGKVDELVEERVAMMKKDHEGQTKALTADRDKNKTDLERANARLAEVLIDSEVSKAVSQVGTVRKGAMQDIIARARRQWKVVEGNPIAMSSDGETPMYGKDGKSHLTFQEWAEDTFTSAAYLFEPSGGSGAQGQGRGTPANNKTGVIPAGDPLAFGKNLEKIAKGEVKVQPAAG